MEKEIRCELISWSEVQRLCLRLAKQIKVSGFHPDLVVAIGRGGMYRHGWCVIIWILWP